MLKSLAPFLLFFFLSTHSKAQFTGLGSFWHDTLLIPQIKAQKVSCVTERITKYNNAFNGRYCFDSVGRVIETINGSGQRIKYEYHDKNLVSKQIYFEERDSSKINSWSLTTYDKNGRVLKVEHGYFHESKAMLSKDTETKLSGENSARPYAEITKYYGDKIVSTTLEHDSTSGIYNFHISYSYEPEDVDEKGRKQGKKTLERSYFKDNCIYEDEIKYKVNGRIEIAENIETRYTQTDSKGRVLEYGDINYEEAYSTFIQEHPEEISYYAMSPLFIKAIFEGKIKGVREADAKFTYDVKGRLVEKHFYGSDFKFRYDEKNQLVEVRCSGNQHYTELYLYNDKGLIEKAASTHWNPNEEGSPKNTNEVTYTYTYY